MDKETQRVMFSSEFPDWETPDDLYDEQNKKWNFEIDVAATKDNAKCGKFLTPEEDIFKIEWSGVAWLNPPYNKPESPCKDKCRKKTCSKRGYHVSKYVPGQIDFIARASEMAKLGKATTVCLLPARTDTAIFHSFIWDKSRNQTYPGVDLEFLEGRLKFKGARDFAPFPSMIVVFHKQ